MVGYFGTGCSTGSSGWATIVIVVESTTRATTTATLQRLTVVATDTIASVRDRDDALLADVESWLRDYKAKALRRRLEHEAFVGLLGGPAPVPRDRVQHSRARRPSKRDAWRPRALRRYGTCVASG